MRERETALETIYLPVGGDTSVPHIHYYTVFGLLQSFVLFSVSFGRRSVRARDTHVDLSSVADCCNFCWNRRTRTTIEWTMRLVYRFALDRDRMIAPDVRKREIRQTDEVTLGSDRGVFT